MVKVCREDRVFKRCKETMIFRNCTTVDPRQFVIFKSEHSATRVCDVQSWETKDCKAEADTAAQSWGTHIQDSCWSALSPFCLPLSRVLSPSSSETSRVAPQQSRAGRQVERIARQRRTQQLRMSRIASDNKKGNKKKDKSKQKNKKGNKTGDKRRQKGDKTNKRKQKGDKSEQEGRQDRRQRERTPYQ